MIPALTDEDGENVQKCYEKISSGKSRGIGGDKYYGYEDNLVIKVRNNLAKFDIAEVKDNVALIRGLLQDTMKLDGPVAFAHIDVDWYDPVKTCLERIIPRLIMGASIILDDYQDWSGCQKATEEYFLDKKGFFKMDDSPGSMKITRIKG